MRSTFEADIRSFSAEKLQELLADIKDKAQHVRTEDEAREMSSKIAQIVRQYRIQTGQGIAASPMQQAQELEPNYISRPHLAYLSSRLVNAVRDVERGYDRQLIVSMPPRMGKSTMTSRFTPLWLLRRHPEWEIIMTSHDPTLTQDWAGSIRTVIEDQPNLGVALQRDSGALGRWKTVEGGGMFATSVGGKLIGRGARVLIIDDPISDFAAAHSARIRESLWNWWLTVAQSRLEPPYLVLVTMTRWHEDDFAGRLLSQEYEGDPAKWENIRLPAIAEDDDILNRQAGTPLLSPIVHTEDAPQAVERWEETKTAVGSYVFSSMYQQRPAPQKGAIFDVSWWRFWTHDPEKETSDGRVIYLDPSTLFNDRWIDSWDLSFKGDENSTSYVVGQRWVRSQANRYLITQKRGRWGFTDTIKNMQDWALSDDYAKSPYGDMVHERLVEEKANGAAIIDTLKESVSGLKPVNPTSSKEARARAITPEVESGNVYLPHPTDPGNEWVQDLLSELRNFPHDMYDDQVDALTQALSSLRDGGRGQITVPKGSAYGKAGVPPIYRSNALTRSYKGSNARRTIPGQGRRGLR